MKMRKILGGLLAGALLLTSVPLMDAGSVTARAEDTSAATTSEPTIVGGRLPDLTGEADSVSADSSEVVGNALDGNPSTIWHSGYGDNTTNMTCDGSGKFTENNNYTITLRTASSVSAIGYVPRSGNNVNGRILSIQVYTTSSDSPSQENDWSLVTNLATSDSDTQTWGYAANTQDEKQCIFTTPVSDVKKVRIKVLTAEGETGGIKFASAAEFYVYGVEKEDAEGNRLLYGLTGKAGSQHRAKNGGDNNDRFAECALDGYKNTYWHSEYVSGDGRTPQPSLPASADETGKYNWYTITLRINADIQKLTYVPQVDLNNKNKMISGLITKCAIYTSTDHGSTYNRATDDFEISYSGGYDVEREISLENSSYSANKSVTNVQIRVLNTGGGTTNKYIHASEFRLYGKKSNSVTELPAPSICLPKEPVLGAAIGSEYNAVCATEADGTGAEYTVKDTKWIGQSDEKQDTMFTKYETYSVEVTLEANEGCCFTEEKSVPTTVAFGEAGNVLSVASHNITDAGQHMTLRLEGIDTLAESIEGVEKVFYPDENNEVKFSDEDMVFFNRLENITVTALVRYNDTMEANKAYALFTLEGDNASSGDKKKKYFTFYHYPNRASDSKGGICYAFSDGASTHSASGWIYSKSEHRAVDGAWHEVSLSLKGSQNFNTTYTYGMDTSFYGSQSTSSNSNYFSPCVFKNVYTKAYVGQVAGQEQSDARYNITTVNLGTAGRIGYIRVSGTYYSTANDIKQNVIEKTDAPTMGVFSKEFTRVKNLFKNLHEEDYTPVSWDIYDAADKQAADAAANTTSCTYTRDYATKISAIYDVIKKLEVCHHSYKNGTCEVCGLCLANLTESTQQKYSVQVFKDGTEDSGQGRTELSFGSCLSVTAPATIDNKNFQYWSKDAAGTEKIGTRPEYGLYVTKDMELYAIYSEGETPAEAPAITISNKYAKVVDGKYDVFFEATRDVPFNYEILEQGILYGTNQAVCGDNTQFAIDTNISDATNGYGVANPKVKKCVGESQAYRGVLTFTGSVAEAYKGKDVYARGYVVYKVKGETEVKVTYSSIVYGSFNSLSSNSDSGAADTTVR